MRYPGRVTICISSQAGCGMNCPFCATGQDGPDPQHVDRRDRRAGRPRAPGRCGAASSPAATRTPRCGSATWSSWAWARRWPTTRRPSARSGGSPTRPPTGWACRPAASRCRRSASCRRSTSWPPRGMPVTLALSPARPRRRAARRAGADQHPLDGRRGDRRRPPLLRDDRAPGQHRVRPDQGHERPGLAGRPARGQAQPARARLGARQPDPAQPDPRLEVDRLDRKGVEQQFVERLRAHGIPTTIRDTRGSEIDGACGQLASATA